LRVRPVCFRSSPPPPEMYDAFSRHGRRPSGRQKKRTKKKRHGRKCRPMVNIRPRPQAAALPPVPQSSPAPRGRARPRFFLATSAGGPERALRPKTPSPVEAIDRPSIRLSVINRMEPFAKPTFLIVCDFRRFCPREKRHSGRWALRPRPVARSWAYSSWDSANVCRRSKLTT